MECALAPWTLFEFNSYARVDFRVDASGAAFIIDVNPNPYLTSDAEDPAAAIEAGLSYKDLIGSIVESSLASLTVAADQSGGLLLNFKSSTSSGSYPAEASFYAGGLKRPSSSPWLIS